MVGIAPGQSSPCCCHFLVPFGEGESIEDAKQFLPPPPQKKYSPVVPTGLQRGKPHPGAGHISAPFNPRSGACARLPPSCHPTGSSSPEHPCTPPTPTRAFRAHFLLPPPLSSIPPHPQAWIQGIIPAPLPKPGFRAQPSSSPHPAPAPRRRAALCEPARGTPPSHPSALPSGTLQV